jgi:hypothetical protein
METKKEERQLMSTRTTIQKDDCSIRKSFDKDKGMKQAPQKVTHTQMMYEDRATVVGIVLLLKRALALELGEDDLCWHHVMMILLAMLPESSLVYSTRTWSECCFSSVA